MVDLGKKKGSDDSSNKNKSSSGSGSSSGGGGSRASTPDPYSPSDDEVANYSDGKVSEVSKEWAEKGENLNYAAQGGESEKEYVKRQIKECREFYDDYVDTAVDNLENIEEFTVVNHALLLSLAQNRIGIKDILVDEYGYSESAAISQTDKIVRKAGEGAALSKVCNKVTETIITE